MSDMILSDDRIATLTIQGDSFLEEIAEAKAIVVVEDARTEKRTNKDIVARLGNRTIINVPIFLFDKHIGSVGTGTFGEEGICVPTKLEQEYLSAMASHLAVTLDRIHLLDERKRTEMERETNRQIQEVLNGLLRASTENISLDDILERVLMLTLSAPFLSLQPMGGIFLTNETGDALLMHCSYKLPASLLTMCHTVPFGFCLCGRAAETGQVQFATCVDERHENRYPGILPHGHYNIPIIADDKILGVIVYLVEGHLQQQLELNFLKSVADILSEQL